MTRSPRFSPLPPESLEGVFLRSPESRAFLTGASHRLADARGVGCLIAFGLIWCLFCVPFVGFVGREWVMKFRLARDGRETRGTVLELEHHRDTDSESHLIRYEFHAGPGDSERHEGRHQIREETYDALRVGGGVRVKYWRADPSWSRAEGGTWTGFWGLFFMSAFVSVFVAIGLGLVFGSIYGIREDRLFAREGRLVPGVLLSAEGRTDSDGDLSLKLRYRIEPGDAPAFEATTTATRKDLKEHELPPPGTPLLALWIPPKKHRVM